MLGHSRTQLEAKHARPAPATLVRLRLETLRSRHARVILVSVGQMGVPAQSVSLEATNPLLDPPFAAGALRARAQKLAAPTKRTASAWQAFQMLFLRSARPALRAVTRTSPETQAAFPVLPASMKTSLRHPLAPGVRLMQIRPSTAHLYQPARVTRAIADLTGEIVAHVRLASTRAWMASLLVSNARRTLPLKSRASISPIACACQVSRGQMEASAVFAKQANTKP